MSEDRSELLAELIAKPVGPQNVRSKAPERDYTSKLELSGNRLEAELVGEPDTISDGTAAEFLVSEGQDPAQWEVTGFRKSQWESGGRTLEAVRFTYRRVEGSGGPSVPLDDLFAAIESYSPDLTWLPSGEHGFLVLLGDMQFGKVDGDGVKGTLERTIACINKAAEKLIQHGEHYDIGHVHIAWLGDHIEGFNSQGGTNAWRTPLGLTDQIRLTRRVMLHALMVFAPMAEKVTMAAVPGNHGEAVRFGGKGLTRYDDSHDTEALVAVSDAAKLAAGRFKNVEFMVPETDELTVVTEVAGTVVAHAHGHQWRPGKHFEWWRGQAFDATSAMHDADLLVSGHLHHELIEADGPRTFIQVPAMESESTWWRHKTGTPGSPGLIVAVTKDGRTDLKEVVRADG